MKKVFLVSLLTVFGASAFADSKLKVEIKELTNLAKSTALEACGVASHDDGTKPLLITLKHDSSTYTTLTSEDGKWCVTFKRWNMTGKITVQAATMDFKEKSEIH